MQSCKVLLAAVPLPAQFFHLALVGLLIAIATGQLLHYRGQVIVVQGQLFALGLTLAKRFDTDKPRGIQKVTLTR